MSARGSGRAPLVQRPPNEPNVHSLADDTYSVLLFRDAGTFLETVLDDRGTPAIPDDDTFLADLGTTFGPHGRTDTYSRDFCSDVGLTS